MVSRSRGALESLYTGVCNIIQYVPVKDPVTKITGMAEFTAHSNVKCRLSYSQSPQASPTETGSVVAQVIKLFLAPEITVLPGSKIEVTQHGRTEEFEMSGYPAVYSSHQEITLRKFGGWA